MNLAPTLVILKISIIFYPSLDSSHTLSRRNCKRSPMDKPNHYCRSRVCLGRLGTPDPGGILVLLQKKFFGSSAKKIFGFSVNLNFFLFFTSMITTKFSTFNNRVEWIHGQVRFFACQILFAFFGFAVVPKFPFRKSAIRHILIILSANFRLNLVSIRFPFKFFSFSICSIPGAWQQRCW